MKSEHTLLPLSIYANLFESIAPKIKRQEQQAIVRAVIAINVGQQLKQRIQQQQQPKQASHVKRKIQQIHPHKRLKVKRQWYRQVPLQSTKRQHLKRLYLAPAVTIILMSKRYQNHLRHQRQDPLYHPQPLSPQQILYQQRLCQAPVVQYPRNLTKNSTVYLLNHQRKRKQRLVIATVRLLFKTKTRRKRVQRCLLW